MISVYNLKSEGLKVSQQLPGGPGTGSHGWGLVLHPLDRIRKSTERQMQALLWICLLFLLLWARASRLSSTILMLRRHGSLLAAVLEHQGQASPGGIQQEQVCFLEFSSTPKYVKVVVCCSEGLKRSGITQPNQEVLKSLREQMWKNRWGTKTLKSFENEQI